MRIECPSCAHEYDLPEATAQAASMLACGTCGHLIDLVAEARRASPTRPARPNLMSSGPPPPSSSRGRRVVLRASSSEVPAAADTPTPTTRPMGSRVIKTRSNPDLAASSRARCTSPGMPSHSRASQSAWSADKVSSRPSSPVIEVKDVPPPPAQTLPSWRARSSASSQSAKMKNGATVSPSSGLHKSRHEDRKRVHLGVRYMAAESYVREYAENLSRGGMYITGASHLGVFDVVTVEVDLPGFGLLAVEAEVVHKLTPEEARPLGRRAGVGLAIRSGPDGWAQILSDYLVRLDQRMCTQVVVASEGIERVLSAAGYLVNLIDCPDAATKAVRNCSTNTAGIVVPDVSAHLFYHGLKANGLDSLIVVMDSADEVDEVLAELDRRILAASFLRGPQSAKQPSAH